MIVTERRAHSHDLVGGHGSSNPAAANQNASIYFSIRHSASQWDSKIRIVIAGVTNLIAKVSDFVACFVHQSREWPFHFETAVICPNPDFHFALPCCAIWLFAAATIFSALKPNFFNNCLRGAEAPKVSMQRLYPSEPVYLLQPKSDATSTDTRAFTFGGSTDSR